MKIALIGIGGMGKVHYDSYKNIADAEVIAVADVRTDVAEEKTKGDNVKIYPGMDELLANEQPDIIDICTPSYMHADMSVKALEHGINVLCEKPMSLKPEDCERVIEAAKKNGKLFMTAHVVRFMSAFVYLKNVIDSGELGKAVRVDLKRMSGVPRWSWEDWMRNTELSGGTPIDLAIHDIDYVRYVFGEPDKVQGLYRKMNENNDYFSTEMVFGDTTVSTEAAWFNYALPFRAEYTAVFENGCIEYRDDKIYKNGEEQQIEKGTASKDMGINITSADGYALEIEYFISCVKNNKEPEIVTPEGSLGSVALVKRILDNSIIL